MIKKQTLFDYIQNLLAKIAYLEKKNAELKSRDCWKGCLYAGGKSELIHEILQRQYNITKAQKQLAEAKGIIKQFLNDYPVITKALLDKLEQFIKEE